MKKIYKYPLEITDYQEIYLPIGSEILSAQIQGRTLCLWAMIKEGAEVKKKTTIKIVETGRPIQEVDDSLEYVSTVVDESNGLVWHVFKIVE